VKDDAGVIGIPSSRFAMPYPCLVHQDSVLADGQTCTRGVRPVPLRKQFIYPGGNRRGERWFTQRGEADTATAARARKQAAITSFFTYRYANGVSKDALALISMPLRKTGTDCWRPNAVVYFLGLDHRYEMPTHRIAFNRDWSQGAHWTDIATPSSAAQKLVLQVEHGSCSGMHRFEVVAGLRGVLGDLGEQSQARYYRLTAAGCKQLARKPRGGSRWCAPSAAF